MTYFNAQQNFILRAWWFAVSDGVMQLFYMASVALLKFEKFCTLKNYVVLPVSFSALLTYIVIKFDTFLKLSPATFFLDKTPLSEKCGMAFDCSRTFRHYLCMLLIVTCNRYQHKRIEGFLPSLRPGVFSFLRLFLNLFDYTSVRLSCLLWVHTYIHTYICKTLAFFK